MIYPHTGRAHGCCRLPAAQQGQGYDCSAQGPARLLLGIVPVPQTEACAAIKKGDPTALCFVGAPAYDPTLLHHMHMPVRPRPSRRACARNTRGLSAESLAMHGQ